MSANYGSHERNSQRRLQAGGRFKFLSAKVIKKIMKNKKHKLYFLLLFIKISMVSQKAKKLTLLSDKHRKKSFERNSVIKQP